MGECILSRVSGVKSSGGGGAYYICETNTHTYINSLVAGSSGTMTSKGTASYGSNLSAFSGFCTMISYTYKNSKCYLFTYGEVGKETKIKFDTVAGQINVTTTMEITSSTTSQASYTITFTVENNTSTAITFDTQSAPDTSSLVYLK